MTPRRGDNKCRHDSEEPTAIVKHTHERSNAQKAKRSKRLLGGAGAGSRRGTLSHNDVYRSVSTEEGRDPITDPTKDFRPTMSNIRGLFSDRRSDDDDDSDDGNDRFVGGIGDRGGGRQVESDEGESGGGS